jgi:hypothetical protein
MNQDKVSKLPDITNMKTAYKPSYGERWNKIRPTKTIVFWFVVATVVLTIVIGFVWGGWITGSTAQQMTNDAITQRLSSVCVGQYDQDLGKIQKLRELKETSSYQRDDYVKEQGWATMPGEEKPDNKVADTCAKQLVEINQ